MNILLAFLHIHQRHLWKNKSWTILGMFYALLEIQSKMKNWIYHYSTVFLNYKSIFTNRAILLGLPNAPRNRFQNYQHQFNKWSKSGFKVTVTLATQRVMWIRCRFWKFLKALKHLTSLPSTNYSPLKPKIQNKRISPTVFHEKESLT